MARQDEPILINNGILVTMDDQRRIIDGGAVAIVKDRIAAVGSNAEVTGRYKAEQTIDAGGMLVLPGLINAHTHIGLHLARGLGDDIDLMEAHRKIYYPFGWHPKADVAPQDVFHASRLACVELIKSGSTCIVDQNPRAGEVAKAVETAGLRGVLSPTMMDTWLADGEPVLADRRKVVAEAEEFIRNSNGASDGRIRTWLGPVHEMFVSTELFSEVLKLSDRHGVGIHVHLAETRTEVEAAKAHYGKRSIEYAYDLGLLRRGTLAAHCCWLSERDITLLAKSGASVVHTPVCEMKISDGVTPAPRLMEAGVNVALGTDAAGQCNGSNDIIREMKTATLLHKVNYPLDPEVMPAESVLEMVTINAAKAVGMDNELGSLETGKKADVILVDLKKPHLTPVLRRPRLNVISLLIYSAVGSDVDTMIVDGRVLMLHRRVLSVDEAQIVSEAQNAAEDMMQRTGIADLQFPWRWSNRPAR